MEANPGTFEVAKFAGYRAAGVNRLSIGIQSFNREHLKAIGRVHDHIEARRAIEIAQANFDNINLDLMYGLPNETLDEAGADIETAAAFGTSHISSYHLTIEPNTYFHRYPPSLPDHDISADMQQMVEETLGARGFDHYETSAFACQVCSAATTSTTGVSATTWELAPVPTGRSRFRIGSSASFARSTPGNISMRSRRVVRCRTRM